MAKKFHMSVGEVERLLGMDRRTVDKANIPYFKTPGGHRRYRVWDVRAYLRENQGNQYWSGDAEPAADWHDPLCEEYRETVGTAYCHCRLIAAAREDERRRISSEGQP